MPSISTRMTALTDAIQRRQMEQAAPVDALSASMYAMRGELDALDIEGRAQLLAEMNATDGEADSLNLTMQDIENFIADYGRKDKP